VVVRPHLDARGHELFGQAAVAGRMLGHTVDDLEDRANFDGGTPDPHE
jgi:hypothetical protein